MPYWLVSAYCKSTIGVSSMTGQVTHRSSLCKFGDTTLITHHAISLGK